MKSNDKPRLVVVSHVLPFPGRAGQEKRVLNTLRAAATRFHVTFLTAIDRARFKETKTALSDLCDDTIVMPSLYARNRPSRLWHSFASVIYAASTGLKRSNYLVGQLELTAPRVEVALQSRSFDLALFEYWHGVGALPVFHNRRIPGVVDIHNILVNNYGTHLARFPRIPRFWKNWALAQYRLKEETAWQQFDGIVVMNPQEQTTVRRIVGEKPLFYAPMGVDLTEWPYAWEPSHPVRVGYYGGLGNFANAQDALTCYNQVMPVIWRSMPEAELWLIGSDPPENLKALCSDPRVKVPGFVNDVKEVLRKLSIVVIPWNRLRGFRSRLVEVMALGIPLVTMPEVVGEMQLDGESGVIILNQIPQLADACLRLLHDPALALKHSQTARAEAERQFGFEATYGRLADSLKQFVMQRS